MRGFCAAYFGISVSLCLCGDIVIRKMAAVGTRYLRKALCQKASRTISFAPLKVLCTYYTYSKEPFMPLDRKPVWQSAEEAVSVIKSGDVVFVQGTSATPVKLCEAMTNHGKRNKLKDVTVCHLHTEGPGLYAQPDCEGIFRSHSFFLGANCRRSVNEGRGDFVPIFLSEIPLVFRRKILQVDVALVQVTPPDKHGNCSLGSSIDCTRAALENSKYIIGEVNPRLPRTFGDGVIHMSHCDALVEAEHELPERQPGQRSHVEDEIGRLIASNLVEDGATLQMGIGNIPDAVLASLKDHKDLGIHSEMFSDGVLDLVQIGAITNNRKFHHPGRITGSFTVGTRNLYDFMDDNLFIVMCEVNWVNSIPIIAKNPKVTAINSCIEVDLYGQVSAESVGTQMFSGVGGQIDFLRAAAVCRDGQGKAILAMASSTKDGESKIVPYLKKGSGCVTTRAHIHYLVTEYGIVNMFGKSMRQRAYELIRIAHPDHRESLEKAAFERLKCMPSP